MVQVKIVGNSSSIWTISPPSRDLMTKYLADNNVTMRFSYEFTRWELGYLWSFARLPLSCEVFVLSVLQAARPLVTNWLARWLVCPHFFAVRITCSRQREPAVTVDNLSHFIHYPAITHFLIDLVSIIFSSSMYSWSTNSYFHIPPNLLLRKKWLKIIENIKIHFIKEIIPVYFNWQSFKCFVFSSVDVAEELLF